MDRGYKGHSQQSMTQSKQNVYNYNTAYTPNTTILDKQDYKNKKEILHNNLNDNLLLENITHYTVHINSSDRNYTNYPNPFNFTVIYGGMGKTIDKYFKSDGTLVTTIYDGQPDPKISRKFKNVKSIKLDHVIMPNTNVIEKIVGTDSKTEYSWGDADTNISANSRYIIFKIKDIGNNKIYSTNANITDDCFILYPDQAMGPKHTLWIQSNDEALIYYDTALTNIDKMIFEVIDDQGNIIAVIDGSDNKLNTKTIYDDLVATRTSTDPILKTFTRIHKGMQIDIQITIGVAENLLNTDKNYEN